MAKGMSYPCDRRFRQDKHRKGDACGVFDTGAGNGILAAEMWRCGRPAFRNWMCEPCWYERKREIAISWGRHTEPNCAFLLEIE